MNMITNGVAGMTVASTSLMIASKNIANASVPGYSRQQAVYGTAAGGSVYVSDIERISDTFYVSQQQTASSALGYATTYASQAAQLESLISGESSGLSPSINAFFGSLKAAQVDPMASAYRQEVLSSADSLAAGYNSLVGDMDRQLDDVNQQMAVMTEDASALLESVASPNKEVFKGNQLDIAMN